MVKKADSFVMKQKPRQRKYAYFGEEKIAGSSKDIEDEEKKEKIANYVN